MYIVSVTDGGAYIVKTNDRFVVQCRTEVNEHIP